MANLSCSACSAPMQVFFFGSVELDVCSACHGIWFDARELARVSGRLPQFEPTGSSDRDCPVCAFRMARGNLQSSVIAERCEGCHGFFLDQGELATLAGFDVQPTRGPMNPLAEPAPVAAPPSRPVAAASAATSARPGGAAAAVALAETPASRFEADSIYGDQAPNHVETFWGDTKTPQQVGFACVICDMRFPMSEGNFYRDGLACSRCTPQVGFSSSERAIANGNWLEFDWDSQRKKPTLSLVGFLARLFS